MVRLNLLPEEIKTEIALSKKNAKLRRALFDTIALFFGAAAFVAVLSFYLLLQKDNATKQKNLAQAQIENQAESYHKAEDLYNRINLIKKIDKSSVNWKAILDQVSAITPQNVELDSFTSDNKADTRTKISGKALSDRDIAAFKENLSNSKYFQYVDIESIGKATEGSREIRNFSISLSIKPGVTK